MAKRDPQPFDAPPHFGEAEDTGSFAPGDFEAQYLELFQETLDEGGITEEARARLNFAASALGFDPNRVARLESALLAAYEAKAAITYADAGDTFTDTGRAYGVSDTVPGFELPLQFPDPPPLDEAMDETHRDPNDDDRDYKTPPQPIARPSAPPPARPSSPPPARPSSPPPPARPSSPPPPARPSSPPPPARPSSPPPPARPSAPPPPPQPQLQPFPQTQPQPQPQTQPPPPTPSQPAPAPRAIPLPAPSAPQPAIIVRPRATGPDAKLHDRFEVSREANAIDEQFCASAVLVRHGTATREERAFYETRREMSLIKPVRALSVRGWQKLFHPDRDKTIGDIFGMIASAVLVGRVSALRRHKQLPKLDPKEKADPQTSTVSAVRATGWAASTLGLVTPPIYVAPAALRGLDIIPAMPPAIRVGGPVLSGRSAVELAFLCGRHMSWFRADHFVAALVPSPPQLEEIFWAALSLGDSSLPLTPEVRARFKLITDAIVAVLEPPQRAELKLHVTRFLDRGTRPNFVKWERGVELTACRAGLLVSGDLDVACKLVASDPNGVETIADLESFWASNAASELRVELGVALRD